MNQDLALGSTAGTRWGQAPPGSPAHAAQPCRCNPALSPTLSPGKCLLAWAIHLPRSGHARPDQLKGSKNSICLHHLAVSHDRSDGAERWGTPPRSPRLPLAPAPLQGPLPQCHTHPRSPRGTRDTCPCKPGHPSPAAPGFTCWQTPTQGSVPPPPMTTPHVPQDPGTQAGGLKVTAEDSQVVASPPGSTKKAISYRS